MLSGEGNARKDSEKTTICLCSKKATHFFCTFLCRCFARLQRETSRNFLVTRCRTCSRFFSFFSASHFHLALVAVSISHFLISPPLQNFHFVLSTKKCLVFYLSLQISVALFLVELRWPAAYFLQPYIPNLWT